MPKCSCTDCWQKIEEFHRFHRSILTAQEEYLRRTIKTEIEREPDNSFHEIPKLLNFVEVITNCEEFNVFADEIIKANNGLEDSSQREIKTHYRDNCSNDAASAVEDEIDAMKENDGSNMGEYDDDCDNDYNEEEEEAEESDSCDNEPKYAAGKFIVFVLSSVKLILSIFKQTLLLRFRCRK